MFAADLGHLAVVSVLLDKGAAVNMKSTVPMLSLNMLRWILEYIYFHCSSLGFKTLLYRLDTLLLRLLRSTDT